MNIPATLAHVIAGLDSFCIEIQEQHKRDTGRYWNWEAGFKSAANVHPGLSIMFERYTVGGVSEGWMLRARYTDGVETMQKTIDHGAGGFASDWAEVVQGGQP